MKYTVYLRTNKINGMQYVGQTNNIRKRENCWNCLKARYANAALQKDREEFGLENFDVEVLAEVKTQEEAWKLEQTFIKAYNTVYPNGYNKAYGGRTNKGGNNGYHNGVEFQNGHEPWNKGMKGIHFSPNTEFVGIPILQVKDGEIIKEYSSLISARKDGFHTSAIAACCKGKRKTHGGFEWYYKNDYEKRVHKG